MNPGREMDALVAEKVFGVRELLVKEGYDKRHGTTWVEFPDLPHYSTDIGAAWTVVEKIKEKRIERANFFLEWGGSSWGAGFIEYETYDSPSFDQCSAPTAPHAICLAALKAVGG